MHKFEIAIEISKLVLIEKISFNLACKNIFDKLSVFKDDRPQIQGLVGSELRHHYLLKHLATHKLGVEDIEENISVLLAEANRFYYKKFDDQEVVAIASRTSKFTAQEIKTFLDSYNGVASLIPEDVQPGSEQYLSLRFNTPRWIVKIINKHFGKNNTFKVLSANNKASIPSFKVFNYDINKIVDDVNFKANAVPEVVSFIGKGNPRQSEAYLKNKLLPIKPVYKELVDNVNATEFSKTAMYLGFSDSTYLDIVSRLNPTNKFDLIIPNVSDYTLAKRLLNQFGFKNYTLFEEKANCIELCISEKVDTFYLFANSTNFDALKLYPDYFLRADNKVIDSLINEQRYSLEEVNRILNDGGQLIYVVPTLDKKESEQIIRDFLLLHPEFSLLEEKQHFSYEDSGTSCYIARLLKTKKK